MEIRKVLGALGLIFVFKIMECFHFFFCAFVTFCISLHNYQVVAYAEFLSFNRSIQVVQNQTKFNSFEVLNKHKMVPRNKAQMVIPLCQMISMSIIHPLLKMNNLKME